MASNIQVGIGSVNKEMDKGAVGIGEVWKEIDKIFVGIGGVWKEGWTSYEAFVYFRTGQFVRKLSPSGALLWSFNTLDTRVDSLAVDKEGYAYVGTYGSPYSKAFKLTPEGGEAWQYINADLGAVYAIEVDKNGYVYIGDSKGLVVKITPDSSKVWQYKASGYIRNVAVDNGLNVYCGYSDGTVIKLTSAGGLVWSYSVDDQAEVSIDKDGYVYASGTVSGITTINKINPTTRAKIWSYSASKSSTRRVAIDQNDFVYTLLSGKVVKLSQTKTIIWEYLMNYLQDVEVDKEGCVYIIPDSGTVKLTKLNSNGGVIWDYNTQGGGLAVIPGHIGSNPDVWIE